MLIEHYAGAFPLWLAPVQAVRSSPLPAAWHREYTQKVAVTLKKAGLRVSVDYGSERMNSKIRDAQNQKIPYMLVIGDKEQAARAVSLRTRGGEQKNMIPLDEYLAQVEVEVRPKTLD